MAYPTTPILDNFNRADGGPGANWTGLVNNIQIISNQAASNVIGSVLTIYNVSTYGPESEAYFTMSTRPPAGGSTAALARLVETGSAATVDGYYVSYATTANNMLIARVDNGVGTQLGATISQTAANGDSMGIECIGSAISAAYKAAAGAWSIVGTRTDSTYAAAGNLGISSLSDTSNRIDDFGGGTRQASLAPLPAFRRIMSLVTQFVLQLRGGL